ncbi:tetratricopeptide repeat protein [Brevibacillus agri]|uniref:tetratricopeptide repeat protein n=1 Tax=Brevibacillus agri TaxID=51101 RepID=UPI0004721436|nr:tetratricopeptide repeat protein [Brevibacillus agri]MCG5250054.1 tetratricopeptide repeat protein [Brevibacillus agri]MDN4091374.1 tetratricopeptide repeat protein [Brevibacillus agri]MDR9502930.1 tetratricopeptide repeat protein [Brevibacillus agri]MED1644781.1 tetratricopeptide repeat protein [Brevibacillus agri]MED1655738.1 tetratricopeptide repeat protein [Brevibacillus agri]
MKIEDWFQTLRTKAQSIEERWKEASEQERLQLADQLFYLRQVSDTVVDLWLQFEEKLSNAIRHIKQMEGQLPAATQEEQAETAMAKEGEALVQKEAGKTAAKEAGSEVKHGKLPQEMHAYEPVFRRGEGFYHLRMFQDAKKCFAQLVQESPDWESGRLYYAYSLLFCDEMETAFREFRLLAKSASSPTVVAISYNAIGCILAEEKQWLEAAQAFKTSLEAKPDQEEARYNLALCYLMDGDAQEALDEIEGYLQKHEHDWEAQLLWLRAAHLLFQMDETAELAPPASLTLPNRELDSETLQEMAHLYEAVGNYHRAQICYHFLTERLPKEGWVWHGLAWNTWLIAGSERGLTLMKKAISLAPGQDDFVFSYGWMQLFDGNIPGAILAFRHMLEKDSENRLGQSGMISAFEKVGETREAKRLAKQFLDDSDPYIRSLGYFHLGRLAMIEENWRLAEQYFQRTLPHADQFREIPIYLQLCASKLGGQAAESELVQP